MKNIQHKDFVGQYRNFFPDGFCQHLIDEFDRLDKTGVSSDRLESENAHSLMKKDRHLFAEILNHNILPFKEQNTLEIFWEGLQNCYKDYSLMYPTLKDLGKIRSTTVKMQKTPPMGGYHLWHCEHNPGASMSSRVLVYILYLNTLKPEENGETEFIFQQTRIKPEENLLVIWPAAFTHTHRGNPVYGENSKYIVTGWFNLEQ